MPLVCHGRARRGQVSAGARHDHPERRGSVARRETQERRGRGLGVQAAATAGVIALRARWAVRARVEYGCEGSRRRVQPRSTERRGLFGTSTSRRQGYRGPRRPRRDSPLLCSVARRKKWGCRDEGAGSGAVSVAGAVAQGRYWGGRVVWPLAFHKGGRWGVLNAGMRIGWPERRGSAVRREMHERRGLVGVGAHVAAAAGRRRSPHARASGCARAGQVQGAEEVHPPSSTEPR